jgi:hypothetical protein
MKIANENKMMDDALDPLNQPARFTVSTSTLAVPFL